MSRDELSVIYRLPLTFVRVVGQCRTTSSSLPDEASAVVRELAVTTEVAADPLTAIEIIIDAADKASQKATWTFLPDGRLTGSDVATTVEPLAGWKAALQVGVFAAATAAVLTPPGWAALGLGAAAAAATALAVRAAGPQEALNDGPALPGGAGTVDPVSVGVHPLYVSEHGVEARILANYRVAIAAGSQAHANAALEIPGPDPAALRARLNELDKAMQSVRMAASAYELAYLAWLESKRTTEVTDVDEHLRIDELPTASELKDWATAPVGDAGWTRLAESLRIAVTVDLQPLPEADPERERRRRGEPLQPAPLRHSLLHRPPRPAEVQVWKLSPGPEQGTYEPIRQEIVRMQVSYPGNESEMNLSMPDSSSAVAVTFDDSGALTKLSTETIDPKLQRARELGSLPEAIQSAVASGADVGKAFAPPSLVDRAAEAKAAAELGLVPAAPDPLSAVRKQLEAAQLKAQLKIAQQIATSSSPLAVIVNVQESVS